MSEAMPTSLLLLLSILASTLPILFYIALIYWVDRYEKEPTWLLSATFVWGAVPSILFAFFFNTLLSLPLYFLLGDELGEILSASLIAPIVEESIKGLAILGIFVFWRDEIDSPLDGIIYGAMVGLGFALVENVFYFVSVYQEGGLEAWGINIFLRSIVFGLNHALFSAMTGLGIAIARLTPSIVLKIVAPIVGWSTAVFLHFIHNLSVSFGNLLCLLALFNNWGGLLLTLVIILWALLQERRWLRQYLAEEVALGYLTTGQYEVACSGRQRTRAQTRALFTLGPGEFRRTVRQHHRLSKLAYRKHHFTLFNDVASQQVIESLRRELIERS
jgi:protease PrsW